MSDTPEHQRQVEAIEARLDRQTRTMTTLLLLLLIVATLCLALLLGHLLELPGLTHGPRVPSHRDAIGKAQRRSDPRTREAEP